MGVCPRLNVQVSCPNEDPPSTTLELVVQRAAVVAALQEAQLGASALYSRTEHLVRILHGILRSFRGEEDRQSAFALTVHLQEAKVPPNEAYGVLVTLLRLLDLKLNPVAKSLLAVLYPTED